MRRLLTLLSIAVAMFAAGTLAAQQPRAVSPGDRARVQYTNEAGRLIRLTGQVVSTSDGVLVLRRGERFGADSLAIEAIDSVSVPSRGRDRARGMGKGFLIGAGTGAVLGILSGENDCSGQTYCYQVSRGEATAIMAVVGGGTGAIFGAIFAPRRWTRAELPGNRVSMTPTVGLSSLGFRLNATF